MITLKIQDSIVYDKNAMRAITGRIYAQTNEWNNSMNLTDTMKYTDGTEQGRMSLGHLIQIDEIQHSMLIVGRLIVFIEQNEIGSFYILISARISMTSGLQHYTQVYFPFLLYSRTSAVLGCAECQICMQQRTKPSMTPEVREKPIYLQYFHSCKSETILQYVDVALENRIKILICL